jgi:hypothetical protein
MWMIVAIEVSGHWPDQQRIVRLVWSRTTQVIGVLSLLFLSLHFVRWSRSARSVMDEVWSLDQLETPDLFSPLLTNPNSSASFLKDHSDNVDTAMFVDRFRLLQMRWHWECSSLIFWIFCSRVDVIQKQIKFNQIFKRGNPIFLVQLVLLSGDSRMNNHLRRSCPLSMSWRSESIGWWLINVIGQSRA